VHFYRLQHKLPGGKHVVRLEGKDASAGWLLCLTLWVPTQGMRQPAAWEMEPLEVRYRSFDLPFLQFLKVCQMHIHMPVHKKSDVDRLVDVADHQTILCVLRLACTSTQINGQAAVTC
jgi:hypothetical protein